MALTDQPNAANPEQIRSAALKVDRSIDQANADLAAVMSTPGGRRFIGSLLEVAGIYRNSFDSDPLVMAANEGRRNGGLQLLADIQRVDPEAYIKLLQERLKALQQDQATAEASRISTE